jgi:hypothetical protein
MRTPILLHTTDGTTRIIHMRTRADAERLIAMTEQAEYWAQLSEQVLNQIDAHIPESERSPNEDK